MQATLHQKFYVTIVIRIIGVIILEIELIHLLFRISNHQRMTFLMGVGSFLLVVPPETPRNSRGELNADPSR